MHEECWNIFTSPDTQKLCRDLGLLPTQVDMVTVQGTMDRDPGAIALAQDIVGRSLLLIDEKNPPVIGGIPFNAVSINGFGYNPLIQQGKNAVTTNTVLLPNDRENFRDLSPDSTETTIIVGGREQNVSQPYLFPGAYTLEEVVNKVGSELALWKLFAAKGDLAEAPFLLPLPVKIGMYPGLHDPQGRPAYYYTSRVPYRGERNGVISTGIPGIKLEDILGDSIMAGDIARTLHDQFGLMHNQMVMGNYRVSPLLLKPFIADLATLTPLDTTPVKVSAGRHEKPNQFFGRAYELAHIVTGSILRFMPPGLPDQEQYVTTYIQGLLQYYLGVSDYGKIEGLFYISKENDRIDLVAVIAKALKRAEYQGLFAPNPDIEKLKGFTWSYIEAQKNHVREIIS